MNYSIRSIRSIRSLRALGLMVAAASLATACGTSSPDSSAIDPTGIEAPGAISTPGTDIPTASTATSDPADAPTSQAQPDASSPNNAPATPSPEPAPAPTAPPQPAPQPTPQPEPAPQPTTPPTTAPNQAPTLDVVRVTRRGLNVTVGINASDLDGDDLTLTVSASNSLTGQTIDVSANADAEVFQLPFEAAATGTVTVVTTVTDGIDSTSQTGTIDIAPLQNVLISGSEMEVSRACFIDNPEVSFRPDGQRSTIVLDTRGVSSNQHTTDIVGPIALDRDNPGTQLFRNPVSADFELEDGFVSGFYIRGSFGDIDVNYTSEVVQPGRYQSAPMVSPSDARCWVVIGYSISAAPAA